MLDWFLSAVTVVVVWLSLNGFHPSYLVGGFMGGIVRAFVAKSGTTWDKLVSGFSGAVLAGFAGPLLSSIDLISGLPVSSVAFILGLIGMYLCEGLINIARDYRDNPGKMRDDLRDIVLRLLGGPKDKE
ncbi:MAG: hypothetical protein Q8807_03280 ['Waltheria sp.' little leaf phytoplasma]|nr:hypothetical protein ['Waltheria sp.' little leaf phytoplasma]